MSASRIDAAGIVVFLSIVLKWKTLFCVGADFGFGYFLWSNFFLHYFLPKAIVLYSFALILLVVLGFDQI